MNKNRVIHIPFDGRGKNTKEAAEMISRLLKTENSEESIRVVIPTQWAWNLANLLHPAGGVLPILKKDVDIGERYDLTCFASRGEIGVTAVPL